MNRHHDCVENLFIFNLCSFVVSSMARECQKGQNIVCIVMQCHQVDAVFNKLIF